MKERTRKRIFIFSYSLLERDPRVYRQILFLRDVYDVTAAGFSRPTANNVDFIRIGQHVNSLGRKALSVIRLKIGDFEKYYWSHPRTKNALACLGDLGFDIVLANDIDTLPLAWRLSRRIAAKVFLDAHEYKPREYDDRFLFSFMFQKYWDYICRSYLPKVDAMTTVCEGIANEYQRNYKVDCKVITNAPFFSDLEFVEAKRDTIRMIHHGVSTPPRKLENMVFLMDHLDKRFTLDFMVINSSPKYTEKLQRMAKRNSRINFVKPVPMPDIVNTLNRYDIGLFLLDPKAFNYKLALPNKLFEFIQGRLAIAIWPSPEMARIVKKYQCGVVSEDFSIQSMAKMLNNLSPEDITKFKQRSHEAASDLCAEKNRETVLSIVRNLIG